MVYKDVFLLLTLPCFLVVTVSILYAIGSTQKSAAVPHRSYFVAHLYYVPAVRSRDMRDMLTLLSLIAA